MARTRTRSSEFLRLLDEVRQPVYVLNDEHRIVYCNQECLDWLGRSAEELRGCRCAYHSGPSDSEADAAAAALCPPPQVLAGQQASGIVAGPTVNGLATRRRARFFPLRGEDATPAALVAIVEAQELSECDAIEQASADSEASALHERIRAFRREMAGRYRLDRLVGEMSATRQARAQAELAAVSRVSVLIVGPVGSGRQHTANAIHYAARESSGPLVPVECSVLSPELIRSTFAAVAAKYSAQQSGSKGTLLLGDVDRLPAEIQPDVARILLSKPFTLRLISTSRQRLREPVRRGELREDLAAHLSTLVIELPPLSQRRADIPLLAQLLVEELNAKGGKQVSGLTPDALDQLVGYPWPGNLDELAQMMEEAHARAEGPQITVRDLPRQIHLAAKAAAFARRPEETIVLDEFLAKIERELVERALQRAKGNKTKAAKLLGMTRPRLYRLLIQLGLEQPAAEDQTATPDEGKEIGEIPFEPQDED